MTPHDISQLAELLKNAKRIACLTGAGMSTESGIPDFRSTTGLYNTLASEEVFDINRFRRSPNDFYKVIGPLYTAIIEAKPNTGHLALARLEAEFGKQVTIATQNIDGLHQKAASKTVYEVHGTMSTLTCTKCRHHVSSDGYLPYFKEGQTLTCEKCGAPYKPDITFYGEALPEAAFTNSVEAFEKADLVMVLGTSLKVYPAAALPSYRSTLAKFVIINRTETDSDDQADLVIHDSIGEALTKALERL